MNYPIIFSKFETDFSTMGLAVLENNKNTKIKKVVNGEFTLSLILPRNDPKWQYVVAENFILVKTQLFRIRTFEEIRDNTGKLLSNIQCEHVWYDANDCKHIPDFEMIGATPTAILEAAFAGTRFTISTVDSSLANTDIMLSKTNPAAITNKLIENIGGELERDNYTISLRAKTGNNNGVQFRTGKNSASIKIITDSKGLITRLYPYGVDDVDISSVNSGTAYLDSPYINNYDYIHTEHKDYKDISDPAELKTKGLAEFSTIDKDGIDKPKVTIEMTVIELKKLSGRPFETFDCGDTVRPIDEDLNIDYNARIMEYEEYVYEPQQSTVVLSNFRNNIGKFLANLAETRNHVNNMTTPSGKVKAAWFESIISVLQSEIQTGLTKKLDVFDHGIMSVDSIENPTSAMAIVNGMFAIADSKKENGDFIWRTFGTGAGFVADLIIAGVLRLAEALTVENNDGTVKLTSTGLEVTEEELAKAIIKAGQIALQAWDPGTSSWVNGLYFDVVTKKFKFKGTIEAADGIFKGSVTIGEDNNTIILDQFGLDTKFIKWFKNMCHNSSFELFDNATLIPAYWDNGISSSDSNFFGTYSLKLTAGQTSKQTGNGIVNPQWYNSVSTKTRVSFHKKGGNVKIYVLDGDNADAPITLTDEAGNTGTFIEYATNTNWVPESYTVTLTHGSTTKLKVKFENSDVTNDAYIDGVIIEPDYTGKRPSFYTDGPNSAGTSSGRNIQEAVDIIVDGIQIWVQPEIPSAAKDKDVWINTDDYSRYDKTVLTASTTLLVDANEFITVSGSISIILHATTVSGIVKKIYNIGNEIVTITGIINGVAGMHLYPNESVELITDGTGWRY